MEPVEEIRNILDSARSRCRALELASKRFRGHSYATPAVKHVLNTLDDLLDRLNERLAAISAKDFSLFKPHQIELICNFESRLIPILHEILSLIDNSDLSNVPAELTAPIQREVRRLFPNAQVFVVTSPTLTYEFCNVSKHLNSVYNEGFKITSPAHMPQQIYQVAIPAVEYDQALLHCALAHEIGHAFYEERKLADNIINNFDVISAYTILISKQFADDKDKQSEHITPETLEGVRKLYKSIGVLWIVELFCDLFGFSFFGPAYLHTFIHFVLSFELMDFELHSGEVRSHPPNRLRLQLLLQALDRHYKQSDFSPETWSIFEKWKVIASEPFRGLTSEEEIIVRTFIEGDLGQFVDSRLRAALTTENTYNSAQYRMDIGKHVPLLEYHIPPMPDSSGEVTIPGIMNSSWECFLHRLHVFETPLREDVKADKYAVRLEFNKFVMKCLELQEIATTWKLEQ